MPEPFKQPVAIFSLAALQDAFWLEQWEKHLQPLQQSGRIHLWSQRQAQAGTDYKQLIHTQFEQAGIIVLLLSPDFFDSGECTSLMERAIQIAHKGQARVVPLLLRAVDWRESPLREFICLPANESPITLWSNHDEAFQACVAGIKDLLNQPTSAPQTDNKHLSVQNTPTGHSPTQAMPGTSPQYYSCVLSYASEDREFVQKLYTDLQASGVPCWYAEQDLRQGDKIRAEIYQAIHRQEKLLLVLSQYAIKSLWVEEEVDAALDREHQQPGTYLLFPLRLDDAAFPAEKYWVVTVRQRYIGDFRLWKKDTSYQQALQRLLRDLRK
ncbi:MAG TPA: toll/interleukin-1 receptor domain-containing protein [Ktedonobacteraceae bacterium]|nr:toll/interleukin-1 receptor domain-containing protein [Ktedonobacteraceae bacterium]